MKVYAIVLLFAAAVCANDMMLTSTYGGAAPAPAPVSYGGGGGSSSYGSSQASIPAPPCPKNYLFSCQPNLQPAPCAQSASSSNYGSAGAYSANYPTYALPQWGVNSYQAY